MIKYESGNTLCESFGHKWADDRQSGAQLCTRCGAEKWPDPPEVKA